MAERHSGNRSLHELHSGVQGSHERFDKTVMVALVFIAIREDFDTERTSKALRAGD
jgi:hypothetical protein